jgi:hypothetical protein
LSSCPKCGFRPDAPIARRWKFFIERKVPSLNRTGTNRGRWCHIKAYKAERGTWLQWMQVMRANHTIAVATGRRRVTMTRVFSGREREYDRDGMVGGCKAAVDSMTTCGLILGDAPHQAELHHLQRPGDVSGLEVEIEELM